MIHKYQRCSWFRGNGAWKIVGERMRKYYAKKMPRSEVQKSINELAFTAPVVTKSLLKAISKLLRQETLDDEDRRMMGEARESIQRIEELIWRLKPYSDMSKDD